MWASIYVHECVQRRLELGVTAAAVAHRIRTLAKHLGRVSAGGRSPRTAGSCTRTRYCHNHFKAGPRLRGVSHRITARIERQSTDQDGAIIAAGGRFGGWSVFIHGNRLCYTTNNFGER